MNRRLILLRHAKSSWKDAGQTDHERPLNRRGRESAPVVGARLLELGWRPDAVWSSDAARTVETWERMAEALAAGDVPVRFTRDLYLAGLADIRKLAGAWDDALETVLVLGHNPGWENAASDLSGRSTEMTTANAALLSGRGATWNEALGGAWTLVDLVRPRDLMDGGA
ncbi:MAG: SixA phosphatase family protein [Planctomycetota bacterium JB042]